MLSFGEGVTEPCTLRLCGVLLSLWVYAACSKTIMHQPERASCIYHEVTENA